MFWRSHNTQQLIFRVEFRVEFIGKRIHFSVNLGVFRAIFYTYKNPEKPANKGKTARMSGFHVGASNRNRTCSILPFTSIFCKFRICGNGNIEPNLLC